LRVLILGAGVIGVCTAWYLAREGHEVTVLDREVGAGLETSFANGGQISASYAEPWANPGAPRKILGWLGRADAPLRFRPRADWQQWRWGLQFLLECLPSRTERNTVQCLNLALFSRDALKALRAETGIRYDHLERGILQIYVDEREFERGVRAAELMRRYGCDRVVKSRAECIALEPALAESRDPIVGGIYTATDESGDAYLFTRSLAELADEAGVRFRYGVQVESIATTGDGVIGVRCLDENKRKEIVQADAYVVAMGSFSPFVLRPLGIPSLIYPAKGYSLTMDVGVDDLAPQVSITDLAWKIVLTRLGDRLRVAGTAELSGYGLALDPARCEALLRRTFEIFPRAGRRETVRYWAGLRPATPSNVPLLGGTRYRNLWLNTGHGTLGWTMACGSALSLADLIAGRRPQVDFSFLPSETN
jgi:D-amino-acid dehydrogenase